MGLYLRREQRGIPAAFRRQPGQRPRHPRASEQHGHQTRQTEVQEGAPRTRHAGTQRRKERRAVEHQRRLRSRLRRDRLAHIAVVGVLVDEALTLTIHQQAAAQRIGREIAHDLQVLHAAHAAAHRLAEEYAAAVTAQRGEVDHGVGVGGNARIMAAQHVRIARIATRGEDHPTKGPEPASLTKLRLEPAGSKARASRHPRIEGPQAHPRAQPVVAFPDLLGQHQRLDPDHGACRVLDQTHHPCMSHHRSPVRDDGAPQCGKIGVPRETRTLRTMTTRRWSRDRRMIGTLLVARKIERLTTGRVIGFVEADLCVVAHAVIDQPVDAAGTVGAIALHHVLRNDTLQLPHEILEHLARAIRDAGTALQLGLARIHDAAAARGGATAAKAIEHQHRGARMSGLERSAGTCPAKTDHDHVGNAVPVDLSRIGNAQRRLGVSVFIHASGPVRGAWRAADIALRYSPVAAQARENCSHSIRIRFASCWAKSRFSSAKNDFGLHDALTLEKRLPRPYSPPVIKNHQRSAALSEHARGLYG